MSAMRLVLLPAIVLALAAPAAPPVAAQAPADASVASPQASPRTTSRRRARRRGGANVVTLPEFHMLPDGQSRFHCVVHGSVAPAQAPSRGRFEVLIRDAHLALSNDRRPLETRFFETPAQRMTLVRRGNDVVMVFDLRAEIAGEVRTEPREGGGTLVVVQFPAGQFMREEDRRLLRDQAIEPTLVVPVPSAGDAPSASVVVEPSSTSLAAIGTSPRPAPAATPAAQGAAPAPTQAAATAPGGDLDDGTGRATTQPQGRTRPTPTTRTRYDPSLDALDDERPPILQR